MKILHVISSIDPKLGGPGEGIRQLSVPINSMGNSVEVVTLDRADAKFLEETKLKVYALGPSISNYRYNSRLVPWLRKNAQNYDVVILNGIWNYASFGAWRALSKMAIPYFVFTHGMLDPWFKRTYPLKHLKKWLYWPWAEYRVLRDANAVIFTCEEERLLARQSFRLYRVNEAVTTYGTAGPPANGSELAQKFLATYPHLQGKRIALFLSRIHEKKGCDLLLDAFARVAQTDERVHVVMAGPDQAGWAEKLQTRAKALGIADRISWPGMLQGDVKWGAFYTAEIFCLPSHQENFGIVVAEALACGKPVLISNKVNIWREIEVDAAGFVDEDSVEGTVRNLQRWLRLNESSYREMSNCALRCFGQRFHISRAADRLIQIIKGSAA